MSIAIVLTYRPGHSGPGYLPLATEQAFHAHWLPLASSASLPWIPTFATGTSVPLADLPAVIDELTQLATLATASPFPPEAKAQLLTRARLACELLTGIDPAAVTEVFIG